MFIGEVENMDVRSVLPLHPEPFGDLGRRLVFAIVAINVRNFAQIQRFKKKPEKTKKNQIKIIR